MSCRPQPECEPYVMRNEWHIDNYETASEERRRLCEERHPDKNSSPEASERFMEINQAYEVLTDPTRKERFDRYGSFDEPQQRRGHHYHHPDFDSFFNFAFGGFDRGGDGGKPSFFETHRITMRMYTHSILEKTHTQPFLIFAYSSYCHGCFMLEHVWKEAVTDLEALGYGSGTVNYMFDGNLFETLRITQLPSIVVVVEGRVVHFRGNFNHLNAKAIRLFARDAIPYTFMQKIITYHSLRRFLDQWEGTNKISVLMLGANEEPRLRYLLTAMKYSHFARFAYAHLNYGNKDVEELKAALAIRCVNCENILVFKDEPEHGPVERLSAESHQMSTDSLSNLVERNKFLNLPRLSSMEFFDQLCPTSSRGMRHFCVILPVTDSSSDTPYVRNMRQFAKGHGKYLEKERIRLVYVFDNKQRAFMDHFGEHNSGEGRRDLLVILRNEYVKAKFMWIRSAWPSKTSGIFFSE